MADDLAAQIENEEWAASFDAVLDQGGASRAGALLEFLHQHVANEGVPLPLAINTPYINTIPVDAQPLYPGDLELERRIRSIIRWNAMAMVVRANRRENGIGGHISTYASAATLYEVGFNHFFRAPSTQFSGDHVYIQGHATPGIYARAFLEGRLTGRQLENFRRELAPGGGLSSYPHPRLMPTFWQFPTVSMGLGPIMAIYHARYKHYLEDRGLKPRDDAKVWAFLGDGETDEPESLGAITLAARERLDNLIFVVNCNLQRLDGPVRGNGKIIQELEAVFRGAGWNVIKVIWGRRWDELLARDTEGLLVRRMGEVVDGEYQRYKATGPASVREHFFGAVPELAAMVAHMSNDDIWALNRGGHDSLKVYAAYQAAVEHTGRPTVILAKTIKGYGLGEAGEGRNITHQQKKLNEDELKAFRTRFGIPLRDDEVVKTPFYKPPDDSPEMRYLLERRRALGGALPARRPAPSLLRLPNAAFYREFHESGGQRKVASTMALVKLLGKLMRNKSIGRHVVPIVPDECRTFGMESFFREFGIYSHAGQTYEPVDADTLLFYREARDGQLLEEGITEAGSMSSFIAAGSAYATMHIPTIPFFLFYSMFGFQRIGDLIWAAADTRCRGFLIGATAGRTTLAGEGLQHQDGHSLLLAHPVPSLLAYDPAFAFEIAVIVEDGLRRMYRDNEDILYYLTVTNEPYLMPAMPDGAREGILKGMYLLQPSALDTKNAAAHVQLLGSGAILQEVLQAQTWLAEQYRVAADVWSVTSYKQLYLDAMDADRWNCWHPDAPRLPYIGQCLNGRPGVCVAASDYVKALPDLVARWVTKRWISLGTDGFGRSESRAALRDFFEVDARHIVIAALSACAQDGTVAPRVVQEALVKLEIDPGKPNPLML